MGKGLVLGGDVSNICHSIYSMHNVLLGLKIL